MIGINAGRAAPPPQPIRFQKLESKNGLQSASERAAKSEGKRVAKVRSFAKQINASSKRATAKPAEQQPERVRICLNL